ncbi:YigZ family protein [Psychroflexus sp. CAK57W]|uniref:IMPACT family protein n=1 Tax=Psychroflexus curvus TaxID=2873595 RepID=UPI001CCB8B3D|nr:YigZ family protein [Psychroflexus curvus]MBZ9627501.1 YigZ family protein [Psychroflexus curvus]MBZ9785987.1 YigZ family protein [Psychroflexus curvus]
MEKDAYKTIDRPSSEILFKERASKFFGYAFPVVSEDDVESALLELKSKHNKAGHFCYAWQIGKNYEHFRVNDDGEPSNSAGMPILGQLQNFEVTNILIVVVRYFGGTKLGVGGLISAYKTAAKLALENSKLVSKTINLDFDVTCEYDKMNLVMRLVKEYDLEILEQDLKLNCQFKIGVRKKEFEMIYDKFEAVFGFEVSSSHKTEEE